MTPPRRGWSALPREERRAVITMVWLVPAVHMAVRLFDYRRTHEWLERRAGTRPAALTASSDEPAVWQLAIARVGRYSWLPGNCLSRSLALLYVLRSRGQDAHLQLGVSLAGGAFAAHAWVTQGGLVLNDTQDVASRYVPLASATPLRRLTVRPTFHSPD